MTPVFPRFKTLRVEDYASLAGFVEQFPVYSDFNAISLLTWGVNNSTRYCFLNSNLVIQLRDYVTNEAVYSVLGTHDIPDTLKLLLAYPDIEQLDLVPEFTVQVLKLELPENSFEITPQRDEYDYVYSVARLAGLEGPDYRKFRRSLSNFDTKNVLNPKLRLIKHDDELALGQILNLTKFWRSLRSREFSDAAAEYYAIRRAVHFSKHLPIDTWGLFEQDLLLGFVMTEDIGEHTVLHFEKANTALPGTGSVLKHEVFKALHERGQKLLNYEQDLGIEGLREAKLSLKPDWYMRKYSIRNKSGR